MLPILQSLLPLLFSTLIKFIPDAQERLRAQEELTKALLAHETELLAAAREVMAADARSENRLTSAARPIVVFWSLGVITLIVVLSPFGAATVVIEALKAVPSDLWTLITAGVGIFMFGRGAEQVVRAAKS